MSADITLNAVKKSICGILDKEFKYEVYADEIPQGFKEPSFFVEIVNTSQKKSGQFRYKRNQTFCVHFFPEDNGEKNESIVVIIERLYFLLEYIKVNGSLCRGANLRHERDSGILHFFVDYNYHLLAAPAPDPTMKQLKHKGGVKHE